MDRTARTKRRLRPMLATLVAILIAVALGFGYASPYFALNELKHAADERDAETVDEYVDFPALRESLKQQVTGLLTRRLDTQGHGNPFAAIGAMIGVALIGPLVDAYATPDGVAALLNGMPPRGVPGERPPPAGASAPQSPIGAASGPSAGAPVPVPPAPAVAPPQPPDTTAGYHGINEFVVTYQHGVGDTHYSAIFRRDGLFSWKLSAVDLGG